VMNGKQPVGEEVTTPDEVSADVDQSPDATGDAEEGTTPAKSTTKVVAADTDDDGSPTRGSGRRLSISVRSLLGTVVIVALVAGIGVLAWLYVGAHRELGEKTQQAADNAHAEQIALDYATSAAAMNYQEIPAWKSKLTAGTTPELNARLSGAADQMQQILVPLQWNSTARPLAAKVRSRAGSGYIVDAFVSVLTKTVQGPEPLQSTATYSVTVDSNQNWQITDVGGIDAAVKGP